MPRYFFHTLDGEKVTEDREGSVLAGLEEARKYAVQGARELLAEAIKYDGKPSPDAIVIVDHHGKQLFTVIIVDVLPEKIRLLLR
jgi:hypothetical protein